MKRTKTTKSDTNIEFSVIYVFPYGKVGSNKGVNTVSSPKDSPYFATFDIDMKELPNRKLSLGGKEVTLKQQVADDEYLLTECSFSLEFNRFDDSLTAQKDRVASEVRELLRKENNYLGDYYEEFTVIKFDTGGKITAAEFVDKNLYVLSRLLRGIESKISQEDAVNILSTRASYSQNDLMIVDWEGAILIDAAGDFADNLELFRLANYQLLKYRIVERDIDEALEQIRQKVAASRGRFSFLKKNMLIDTIEKQLDLLIDFEKIDQSIMLIGDWYSAKVYRQITEELYLDDWKKIVKEKLEVLREIEDTVRQNVTLSWDRIWDRVQLVGWMVLLIGYFIIFFRDVGLI